jgi:hypothetical protein
VAFYVLTACATTPAADARPMQFLITNSSPADVRVELVCEQDDRRERSIGAVMAHSFRILSVRPPHCAGTGRFFARIVGDPNEGPWFDYRPGSRVGLTIEGVVPGTVYRLAAPTVRT